MVKWTRHARTQLRQIHDYIARDSAFYARHVVDALLTRTEGLDEFPQAGRIVPELAQENVREVSAFSWRIVYEIRSQTRPAHIDILAVVHKRRDLQPDDVHESG